MPSRGVITSFNPRTPCGVRLTVSNAPVWLTVVSIHALLAECDKRFYQLGNLADSFNPRTPCGVRHKVHDLLTASERFQSTHSLRSATTSPYASTLHVRVSIHALLAECDHVSYLRIIQ